MFAATGPPVVTVTAAAVSLAHPHQKLTMFRIGPAAHLGVLSRAEPEPLGTSRVVRAGGQVRALYAGLAKCPEFSGAGENIAPLARTVR